MSASRNEEKDKLKIIFFQNKKIKIIEQFIFLGFIFKY